MTDINTLYRENQIQKLFLGYGQMDLFEEVKWLIRHSEDEFNAEQGQPMSDFLWQHSVQVALIADKLALSEGHNRFSSALAGLMHDAGKFFQGQYHKGEKSEESIAADLAKPLFARYLTAKQSKPVCQAIASLYQQHSRMNSIARILHDADRLAKMGPMAVSSFFNKAALRQQSLLDSIRLGLSKEISYAANAELAMLTGSGRHLAQIYSPLSLEFFYHLLKQQHDLGLGQWALLRLPMRIINKITTKPLELINYSGLEQNSLGLTKFSWQSNGFNLPFFLPRSKNGRLSDSYLFLVTHPACPQCDSQLNMCLEANQGIKCHKLIASWKCLSCLYSYEIAFCLPELASFGKTKSGRIRSNQS